MYLPGFIRGLTVLEFALEEVSDKEEGTEGRVEAPLRFRFVGGGLGLRDDARISAYFSVIRISVISYIDSGFAPSFGQSAPQSSPS